MTHDVLSQLHLDNRELQAAVAQLDSANRRKAKLEHLEHLEKELQRARSKHDQALQKRQHHYAQLEALASPCSDIMQREKQSPAQRTAAQLESQLAAVGRRLQCAGSMQCYLNMAEQQHRQEQLEAEAQVQALGDALSRAQAKLQEAKAGLIVAKTSKAAAKQALAAAEQQLAAGRARRATLMQQVLQCQSDPGADGVVGGCTLGQAMRLCAAMPAVWNDIPARQQQWLQDAATAVTGPEPAVSSELSAVDAVNCLLECYGASDVAGLLESVGTTLRAAASLRAALMPLGSGGAGGNVGGTAATGVPPA